MNARQMTKGWSIFPRKLGIETDAQRADRMAADRDYWRDCALKAEAQVSPDPIWPPPGMTWNDGSTGERGAFMKLPPVTYNPEAFRQAIRDGEIT